MEFLSVYHNRLRLNEEAVGLIPLKYKEDGSGSAYRNTIFVEIDYQREQDRLVIIPQVEKTPTSNEMVLQFNDYGQVVGAVLTATSLLKVLIRMGLPVDFRFPVGWDGAAIVVFLTQGDPTSKRKKAVLKTDSTDHGVCRMTQIGSQFFLVSDKGVWVEFLGAIIEGGKEDVRA